MPEVTATKKEIWTMGSYSLLTLSIMVGFMYLNQFATSVLEVPTAALATAMLIGKTIDFIVSVFCGAIIEKVKLGNKGKNQEWLAKGRWVLAIVIMLEVFPTSGPVWLRLLVMTAAYAVLNSLMNILQTAYYGISAAVAGPNPSNRQAFNINMSRQATVITLITSTIPTLVTVLDFGKWNYFVVATAFMIPMPFALGAIAKLADGKDAPVGAAGAAHQVSAVDMFKSLGENKYLLVLFLCHTIQYIGQFIFQGLAAYYWMFVVGNFSLMTVANLVAAVTSFVAAMIMPPIGQKLGKKKAISIGYFLLPVVNFCMGYFGRFGYIYMIAIQSLNTFAMYTYTPFVMLMYMDAAEWYFNKSGKDTRGIVMGLATPPMKIGMALGGTIGLMLLSNTGFDTPGVAGSAEWIPKFMTITYWVPACFYLVMAILFVLLYRLSDEEAARCAQENYAKFMASQQEAPKE